MAGVPTAERTGVPHLPTAVPHLRTAEAQLTVDALLGPRMAAGLRVMAAGRIAGPRLRTEDGLHPTEVAELHLPVAADTRLQAAEATAVAEAATVAADITNVNTLRQGKAALCGRLSCFRSCQFTLELKVPAERTATGQPGIEVRTSKIPGAK